MMEKIILDNLTQDSVSVRTQRYFDDNGTLYPIGQPHRKAYVNSVRGRQEVKDELPQAQQNTIFAVWGDMPTVSEEIE